MLLENQTIAITGASKGIGLECAKACMAHGANVILLGRSMDSLIKAQQQLNLVRTEQFSDCIPCDVSDPTSVKEAFQLIFKRHKRLTGLVANAGVLNDALIGMVSNQQIQTTFAVNTFGVLYCAQYASRLISRSGGGAIVNMASIIGVNGNEGQSVYGGSKAAVIGITKSLAKELAKSNVRVNAIAPGFIDTDMARSIGPVKFAERVASVKMGRAGTPADVANVAVFLLSGLSTYVTGQVIGVDGGMLI
jgi:3-oxoacyl-[acyl-carrier protein] reductase